MRWRIKAGIQTAIALLPPRISYEVYYQLQRRLGGLRHAEPVSRLRAGAEIVKRIHHSGRSVADATCLEVGTGHQLNLPIALWLCGAARLITVDLNRYLRAELVLEDLSFMRARRDEILALFQALPNPPAIEQRLDRLLDWRGHDLEELLNFMSIQYLAPADATCTHLDPASIDYHVSYTVLEHIPPAVLEAVFGEGLRILKPSGLLIHCIDFTDHFAHSDTRISSVNFLQFSEARWARLSGNRYMYHNRLRIDEFLQLLHQVGVDVLSLDTEVDESAEALLRRGALPLDARFRGKSAKENATKHAWVVCGSDARSSSDQVHSK